jgi:hypothetical protein
VSQPTLVVWSLLQQGKVWTLVRGYREQRFCPRSRFFDFVDDRQRFGRVTHIRQGKRS